MKTNTTPQEQKVTSFKTWYRAQLEKKVKSLKRSGTTAMGADNLFALVRVPNDMEGAPVGTNARWLLKQYFNEAVISSPRVLIDFVY